MEMGHISLLLVAAVAVAGLMVGVSYEGNTSAVSGRGHNYADALRKCILFFEGQRSGKLPANQRLKWRRDSALLDGHDIDVDLVGGYYDAGDNVKFGFPMAFSITLLGWSILEFGRGMGDEAQHAMDALRWGTDYLLKATAEPNKVHVQVGDAYSDHNCWERPEDMDTLRTVYTIDPTKPGSEVAAETAAALTAGSLVFRQSDPNYANILLQRAISVFDFAEKYRGSYSQSLGKSVCPFYCDWSGYEDELIWGAAWLHKATNGERYHKYVSDNIHLMDTLVGEFGWDDKHAGIFVLLNNDVIQPPGTWSDYFHQKASEFVCQVLPDSPTKTVSYSPGGLMFKPGGTNMQHPTALSFLLAVFAQSLLGNGGVVHCGDSFIADPYRLIKVSKSQVDYILGDNPLGMSYMVGYGTKFPQRIHHRGSSVPSVEQHPAFIPCKNGTPYFISKAPNPNLLIGALVGGPAENDTYADSRSLFVQSEPTTYLNAPMTGLLGFFKGGGGTGELRGHNSVHPCA